MPWREDFVEAFWVEPEEFGLGGWPEAMSAENQTEACEQGEPAGERVDTPIELPEPLEAVILMRDRIGFRYERVVGLEDFLSQREAAQLLSVPVMTVNRWVRARKLPSRKRNGFSVVKLRDVLSTAKKQGCDFTMKGRLHVQGVDYIERKWITTRSGNYGEMDEERT